MRNYGKWFHCNMIYDVYDKEQCLQKISLKECGHWLYYCMKINAAENIILAPVYCLLFLFIPYGKMELLWEIVYGIIQMLNHQNTVLK